MTFTIDDILQIAFFQLIYIILLIYLTLREMNSRPKTGLLRWLLGVDVFYAILLVWLCYTVSPSAARSITPHFRWNVLLFSILIPCLLLLLAFTAYNIRKDIQDKHKELKQH